MHLLTHGFFKAGLFLGAGSVMHAMNDEVNMRRYGGLRKALPITFATFGLGYLAIIGVPPLAGFFSKDGIIEAALGAGGAKGIILGGAAMLGAGITAFYMTRVMLMTFFGEKRWADDVHPHEAPAVMTWPMILLAVGSVVSGGALAIGGTLEHWLEPVVGAHEAHHASPGVGRDDRGPCPSSPRVSRSPTACTAPEPCRRRRPTGSALTVAARQDLYGDAFNERVFMRPGQALTNGLVEIDDEAVDGAATGLAVGVGRTSERVRLFETGFARSYALSMFAGAILVVGGILVMRLW